MKQLLRIDEITAADHVYISEEDLIFYFWDYTPGKDFNYSEANGLIYNLKKSMRYRDQAPWYYKGQAITRVAALIRNQLIEHINTELVTFVPLPPSKAKEHALYDDRIFQILCKACHGMNCDVRELLNIRNSREAAHESDRRPTVAELEANFMVDLELLPGVRQTIYLVDDVLTNGTTFVAARNILQQHFPEAQYVGLFVARRVPEKGSLLDFLDDW